MENNSTKAVKSGFWYVISNVLIRSVGIITAPIYSKLLTTEETGYANSFLSYVSIITVVTCLCLIYSVGRAKLDFKDEFDEFMSSIQTLSSGFGLIVMILMMIICPAEGMMNFPRYVVIMLFAYLTIFPSIDYMQYKYRFEYRYKENIAISVFITISTVVLTVAFILLFPSDKGLMKILGTLVPSSAVAIWCYINILKSGKTLYKKKYWVYALKIGLPMIPHGLSLSILSRIDTTMVQNTCGFSDAGLYTSGYTIGTLLTFIIGAVGQAWLPWFNEQMYAENRDAIREKNKILMFYGCVLTIFFIAAAPEAVKILFMFNRTYWDSMWVVPPVALGTLCQYFYTNYVNLELYMKKTTIIAGNSILAAVINTGLNAYFIPKYGYIAAAYTTLAGYFILMILHFLSTRLMLKEKIYADGLYFIMVILTSVVSITLTALYSQWILRYVLLIAVAVILAIVKKNDIIMAICFVRRKFFKS